MKPKGVEKSIEILDANTVMLDSVVSVIDYSDDYIIFKLKKYSVKIIGDGIEISEFTEGNATVKGRIFSLTFLYN